MNKVALGFEYSDENKAIFESAIESFLGDCISYGRNIKFKITEQNDDIKKEIYGEVCEHCGKYEMSSQGACEGCPLNII